MTSRCSRVLAITAVIAGIGCSAQHHHGDSVRAALRAQAAPSKKVGGAVEGLDSQEASIIAGAYRRSLAPKDDKTTSDQVILVAPNQAGTQRPQALAPSVPKER